MLLKWLILSLTGKGRLKWNGTFIKNGWILICIDRWYVLKRKGKIVTDKQEIEYLMELIQKLYADGQLELDGVRKIFDRMEAA